MAETSSKNEYRLAVAATDALRALDMIKRHLDDLYDSNPGFMGNMCLQDYALWNESLIMLNSTLRKHKHLIQS